MRAPLRYGIVFLSTLVALGACTPEERDYDSGTSGTGATGQGGSGGGGSGQGGADPGAKACETYGAEVCKAYQKCSPETITVFYRDFDTCQKRYALHCSAYVLGAPETSWTPERVAQCAASFGPLSCAEFITLPFRGESGPPACAPAPGPRADGAPCLEGGQCQSAYCKRAGLNVCGGCAPVGTDGAPCDKNPDCIAGYVCFNNACTKASQLGENCVPGQIPCEPPLVCDGAACVQPLGPGETCTPNPPLCDFFRGLYCNTVTNTCKLPLYAGPGEQCGIVGDDIVLCSGAGICNPQTICVTPAEDGQPCNVDTGPGCMLPAVCSAGICLLPKPGLCE